MKHWTFQDQTAASFLLILAAAVAAALLHASLIGRLAFLAVGAAYVIRAVPPVSVQIQWGKKRARWFPRVLGLSFLLYGLFAHF